MAYQHTTTKHHSPSMQVHARASCTPTSVAKCTHALADPTHDETHIHTHTYTHTYTHIYTHTPTKGGAGHATQLRRWHVVCIWPRLSADGHVAWSSETHTARPTSTPQANTTQHLCMGMLQHMHMPTSPLKGRAHPTYPHIRRYTHTMQSACPQSDYTTNTPYTLPMQGTR